MRLICALLLIPSLLAFKSFKSLGRMGSRTNLKMSASEQFALLFDCDGVIVETEELHRIAYNAAFEKFGLKLPNGKPVVWDTKYYDILQNTVGGGKPKMNYYFNNDAKAWPVCTKPEKPAPVSDEEKKALVDLLQDTKTEFYTKIIEDKAEAREGVLELMDEAIKHPNIKVGICSAATRAGFDKLVHAIVGPERLNKLDIIVAGDDVSAKKPDPMIYNVASNKLNIPPERCVVVEDSIVGLKAAKGAGMKCIITYTDNTKQEDFYGQGADAKVPSLQGITLDTIFKPLREGSTDILVTHRDVKQTDKATGVTTTVVTTTTTTTTTKNDASTEEFSKTRAPTKKAKKSSEGATSGEAKGFGATATKTAVKEEKKTKAKTSKKTEAKESSTPVAEVKEVAKPAAEAPKPVTEVKAEAPKPVVEAPKPKVETPKPVAEVKAEAPKPVVEAPKPKVETPKPVAEVKAEAPKPKVETPKPVTEVKAEAPKPVAEVKTEASKPVTEVKAEAPKPVAEKVKEPVKGVMKGWSPHMLIVPNNKYTTTLDLSQ